MPVRSVLVCGAGIGGLACAAALGQRGVEVDVVEIKPADTVQGVGISVPANALRVLKSIGVLDAAVEAGLVLDSYRFYNERAEPLATIPMPVRDDGVPSYIGIPRPEYGQLLREAAEGAGATVRYCVAVDDLAEDADGVHVRFTDGTYASYDVVAGFDGVRSASRTRSFGSSFDPVYTGVGCWRVNYDRPVDMRHISSFQGVGTKAGLIPINADSMYLFHLSVEPESLRKHPETFREVLEGRLAGYEGIIGEIRDHLPDWPEIVYSPLERVLLPPPWHRGRVVLGGDAAHAMSPNVSQGGSSALEDALVLAQVLAEVDPLEEALTQYAARRYPRAKFVQDLSHQMLLSEVDTSPEVVAGRAEQIRALPEKLKDLNAFLSQPL
jgi:2-polyprenyl-6-methoxyphenol hydroxylase-like FAD-dependent oxidoreductase